MRLVRYWINLGRAVLLERELDKQKRKLGLQ
jgi:hypothetical protein